MTIILHLYGVLLVDELKQVGYAGGDSPDYQKAILKIHYLKLV